jgi:hypothetical protein
MKVERYGLNGAPHLRIAQIYVYILFGMISVRNGSEHV